MTTLATIALYVLAFIGALSVLSSVGVFIMTWRMSNDPPMPASEVVARHTGNVRVVSPAVVGTFGHGAPPVETCRHCGEPSSHACDLDDFIAYQASTPRDAS